MSYEINTLPFESHMLVFLLLNQTYFSKMDPESCLNKQFYIRRWCRSEEFWAPSMHCSMNKWCGFCNRIFFPFFQSDIFMMLLFLSSDSSLMGICCGDILTWCLLNWGSAETNAYNIFALQNVLFFAHMQLAEFTSY